MHKHDTDFSNLMWLNSATRTHLQAVTSEWLSLTLGVSTSYPSSPCSSPVPPTPPPLPISLHSTSPQPPALPVRKFTPSPQKPSSKYSPVQSQKPITESSEKYLYSNENYRHSLTARDISEAFGLPQKLISNHNQERKMPRGENLCVKENFFRHFDSSSEPDPYDQLMFLTRQLHNELEVRFANQSTNEAKQEVLLDWPVCDESLSVGPNQEYETKDHEMYKKKAEEQCSVILSEMSTFHGPVAEIDWGRLPELYIREEDDEIIHRSEAGSSYVANHSCFTSSNSPTHDSSLTLSTSFSQHIESSISTLHTSSLPAVKPILCASPPSYPLATSLSLEPIASYTLPSYSLPSPSDSSLSSPPTTPPLSPLNSPFPHPSSPPTSTLKMSYSPPSSPTLPSSLSVCSPLSSSTPPASSPPLLLSSVHPQPYSPQLPSGHFPQIPNSAPPHISPSPPSPPLSPIPSSLPPLYSSCQPLLPTIPASPPTSPSPPHSPPLPSLPQSSSDHTKPSEILPPTLSAPHCAASPPHSSAQASFPPLSPRSQPRSPKIKVKLREKDCFHFDCVKSLTKRKQGCCEEHVRVR
ncbi:uncharacterized protein LOC130433813 [Triplophysa dalaica]|uniref:uncharacterized protein LOC130433813 n=1 Tax=Triplophysa dalaica TaxID=1582913 RepID=UPI0024DF580B|nr:uncharacterized protein LOC130433813 [Triplophysa dalaica]